MCNHLRHSGSHGERVLEPGGCMYGDQCSEEVMLEEAYVPEFGWKVGCETTWSALIYVCVHS